MLLKTPTGCILRGMVLLCRYIVTTVNTSVKPQELRDRSKRGNNEDIITFSLFQEQDFIALTLTLRTEFPIRRSSSFGIERLARTAWAVGSFTISSIG